MTDTVIPEEARELAARIHHDVECSCTTREGHWELWQNVAEAALLAALPALRRQWEQERQEVTEELLGGLHEKQVELVVRGRLESIFDMVVILGEPWHGESTIRRDQIRTVREYGETKPARVLCGRLHRVTERSQQQCLQTINHQGLCDGETKP